VNEPDRLPTDLHPEAALLPSYSNRTLNQYARRQVEEHLAVCTTCRAELEDIVALKHSLATFYTRQTALSREVSDSIRSRVMDEARHSKLERRPWFYRADECIRMFLMPRWAPTFVAALLVVQMSLLLWLSIPGRQSYDVMPRSLDMRTATISVVFRGTATEDQIRRLLQSVHGRIVDGPSADGGYTVVVPAVDGASVQEKLDALRARGEVVQFAEEKRS
jgi:hypothetical protein